MEGPKKESDSESVRKRERERAVRKGESENISLLAVVSPDAMSVPASYRCSARYLAR